MDAPVSSLPGRGTARAAPGKKPVPALQGHDEGAVGCRPKRWQSGVVRSRRLLAASDSTRRPTDAVLTGESSRQWRCL